jgi:hypothetical protein
MKKEKYQSMISELEKGMNVIFMRIWGMVHMGENTFFKKRKSRTYLPYLPDSNKTIS